MDQLYRKASILMGDRVTSSRTEAEEKQVQQPPSDKEPKSEPLLKSCLHNCSFIHWFFQIVNTTSSWISSYTKWKENQVDFHYPTFLVEKNTIEIYIITSKIFEDKELRRFFFTWTILGPSVFGKNPWCSYSWATNSNVCQWKRQIYFGTNFFHIRWPGIEKI